MNDQQNGQILGDQDPNVTDDMYDDLGGGIASSFPVISYRNSRWRVRWQGAEELLVDQQNRPVDEIGVCLVRVPNHKSKRYWIGGYPVGGSNKPPDCWSNDSIKPHPSLVPPAQPQGWPNPQPTTCAQCYWDQFSTALRQDGSVGKGKACADYKRCVVKIYYPQMPLGFEAADGQMFLMQIPPDSLQAIKKYGEDLAKERLAAAATVTFVGLVVDDQKVSYPKLTFRKGPKLSSEEIEQIKYARGSDETARILNEEIAFIDPDAIAYNPEPAEQEQAPPPPPPQARAPQPQAQAQTQVRQPVPPQPQPQQVRAPQPQQVRAPQPQQPQQTRTGLPPQPQREPTQPTQAARVMPQPNVPAARAIDPRMAPRPTQQMVRQPGPINQAINRPAPPPPSNRPVRPNLPEPPPVQDQAEYGTAGEVEDELDRSFGDLAARGIIEQ